MDLVDQPDVDEFAEAWRSNASIIKGGGEPLCDLLEDSSQREQWILRTLRSWTVRDPFTSMTNNRIRREILIDATAADKARQICVEGTIEEDEDDVVYVPPVAAAVGLPATVVEDRPLDFLDGGTGPSTPQARRRERVSAGKARLRGVAWASKTFTIKHLQVVDSRVAKAIKAAFPEDLHDAVASEVVQVVGTDGPIPSTKELCDAVSELTGVAASAAPTP
jgi:hypothetical protein